MYYLRWVGRYAGSPGTCSWLPLTGSKPVALPDDDRFTQMTSTSYPRPSSSAQLVALGKQAGGRLDLTTSVSGESRS